MRLTDFWARLEQAFGPAYAGSVAADQVLPQLGGRTIQEALDAGEETAWCGARSVRPIPTGFRLSSGESRLR